MKFTASEGSFPLGKTPIPFSRFKAVNHPLLGCRPKTANHPQAFFTDKPLG